jgi:iron complex outermembrane recepter protein
MNTRHFVEPRRLVLSSIALAVLTLTNQASAQQADAPMARVEVTGSSIKRLESEQALPVTVVKAEDIVKQGMTTLADLMMALPESNSLQPSNAGSGTNVNLRGLGVNRTLVLLNGRRLANEATADGFQSLDIIPISALARVEILRDGASSMYGSDAIGGVVNFITKRSYNGVQLSGQIVKPERSGGGDEKRMTATVGTGDLEKDGWNFYVTGDFHKRNRLLEADRQGYVPTDDELTAIGRAPSLGSGGYATSANFTSSANKSAANPYYATGCVPPYSIQGQKNTCILNDQTYGTALHANKQMTMYAKATKKINDDHTISLEYSRGDATIFGVKNPTQAVAVGSAAPILPSTSKWYPGGSGGVPLVLGITLKNAPLTVSWAVADHGPAVTRDRQLNQRLSLLADGRVGDWDYKAGAEYGLSQRDGYFYTGYFNGMGLITGLANGTLNPFGLQDQAGQDYLNSIAADDLHNRHSETTMSGVDATISRPLLKLAGGDMSLAIGADWHRDTYNDTKLDAGAPITYAKFVPAHGEAARNVMGLMAELDMPVTKELDLDAALRADRFSDAGTTVNPKISFRYQPSTMVMFRGSANTGFRAPTLFDRYGYRTNVANTTTSARWDDPVLCPGGAVGQPGTGKAIPGFNAADVCNAKLNKLTGSNASLTPEKSVGGTLGVVFQPARTLTLSLDYWQVNMKNMLANLPEQVYFTQYQQYKDLFVRNPDGSLAYINNTTMNLGGQKAAGVDVSLDYLLPKTSYGQFKVGLDGTYLTRFDNQLFEGDEWVSNIGRFGNASNGTVSSYPIITPRWKHVLKLSWSLGNWGTQLTQTYSSKYTDQNLVAQQYWRNINSYKPWNWTMSYGGIPHVKIMAGITNLFDARPPITNHSGYSFGYLSSVANPIGRAYNLRVTYDY